MTESLFDLPVTVAKTLARANVPDKLPEFVKRRLEAMGYLDPDTGATRRARARRCEVCGSPVMRGINRDFGGLSVDCDPEPLSAQGELQAILAGRATYDLQHYGGRGYQLDRRESWHIRDTPPGTPGIDVLVVHQHKAPALPGMASNIDDNTTPAILPDQPPF